MELTICLLVQRLSLSPLNRLQPHYLMLIFLSFLHHHYFDGPARPPEETEGKPGAGASEWDGDGGWLRCGGGCGTALADEAASAPPVQRARKRLGEIAVGARERESGGRGSGCARAREREISRNGD